MAKWDHEDLKSKADLLRENAWKDKALYSGAITGGAPKLGGENTITTEGTLLGKNVSAPSYYDPSVLVAVPRTVNRDQYGITNADFEGNDLWRCYECSTLTKNGMPVYFSLNIQYNSNSPFLVESKSLKLYLNSFNMHRSAFDTIIGTYRGYVASVIHDLKNILGVDVAVWSDDFEIRLTYNKFDEYVKLQDLIDYSMISDGGYKVNKDLLKTSPLVFDKNNKYVFSGFRSNCKVTKQPDYATVYINITSGGLDPVSLVKYLTSYRNEEHLHEECCELIYKHLLEVYNPKELQVSCCYTRRGGIDITPSRYLKRQGFITNSTSYDEQYFLINPIRNKYQ